jgi:hypothetical protein
MVIRPASILRSAVGVVSVSVSVFVFVFLALAFSIASCGAPNGLAQVPSPAQSRANQPANDSASAAFWLTVGEQEFYVVVERGEELVIQVILTPESVTAFDPVDMILTSVPSRDLTISVHYDGTALAVLSEPVGYLSVTTSGGAVSAHGDYEFDIADLPSGPKRIDIFISFKGASAARMDVPL